ncbi:hypothetical protein [Dietzia sp. 179-F 9C3 NHS]|uniref:hypothetical protein n=1 Tax=Dietzia sp. 179-F 9C3 NHS TaxID=3374295 RepID=UPI003879F3F7
MARTEIIIRTTGSFAETFDLWHTVTAVVASDEVVYTLVEDTLAVLNVDDDDAMAAAQALMEQDSVAQVTVASAPVAPLIPA